VIDVGQGLSVVVRAAGRVLVYDAGPRYSGGFDTGRLVVVPYLRALGIGHIDVLMISHGVRDHAGGTASIRDALSVDKILSNASVGEVAEPCVTGTRCRWGTTEFEVLASHALPVTDTNNNSCVLRVRHPSASLLLPCDIESTAEQQLLHRYLAGDLRADILVAPHHGSRTSSTVEFVTAVSPGFVVFPVGFENRYGFPVPEVVARYQDVGSRIYRSDAHGAVTFRLIDGEPLRLPTAYREQARGLWRW
jgi:competence protein ComEC